MSARPTISPRVMVSVAIRQANSLADEKTYQKRGVFCPLCYRILLSNEARRLEHMTPRATRIALGLDPDAPENLYWVHKECADKKTNGKSKATCADGDIHKIAKAKRVNRDHELHKAVRRGDAVRPPGKIKNRKTEWPSRQFQSREGWKT